MLLFYHCCCFFVGACWASFWITTGQRWANGQRLGRWSVCPTCRHRLRNWQLLPIAGYLLQGGRCRDCGQSIDPLSTVGEAVCGILFVAADGLPRPQIAALFLASSALLLMSATDWEARWINPLLLTGLLPLPRLLASPVRSPGDWLLIVFLASLLYLAVSCHQLGSGDAEFISALLLLVGLPTTAAVLLTATLTFLATLPWSYARPGPRPFIPWLSLGIAVTQIIAIKKGL